MKKISIFVAAFAMIAFAGCKKDNNALTPDANGMVTVEVTGENYTDAGKQTLNGLFNRIMFDNGEDIYFNGVTGSVRCVDRNDPMNTPVNSLWCRISVPAEAVAEDNVLFYPAITFTPGVEDDYSDWTVSMMDVVDIILATEYDDQIDGSSYQAWPMSCHGEIGHGTFFMRNNVAMLAPSVKYGYPFLYAMRSYFPDQAIVNNFESLPTLEIEKVIITSPDAILTGNGHIEGIYTNQPTLVMNNDDKAGHVITATMPYSVSIPAGPNVETIIGNIPAAPMVQNSHIDMDVYFTLTFDDGAVYYGRFDGVPVELIGGQLSVLRSQRTTMCINLYDGSRINQVTIQDTPFAI